MGSGLLSSVRPQMLSVCRSVRLPHILIKFMRACVRACVRACMRACGWVGGCVCVLCMCVYMCVHKRKAPVVVVVFEPHRWAPTAAHACSIEILLPTFRRPVLGRLQGFPLSTVRIFAFLNPKFQ